jgi:hypothetical protein
MSVWQVAAGDGTRDYSDVFLRFGVILVGPGDEGPYFENKEAYGPGGWVYRPFIPVIAEGISEGDTVILKKPSGSAWEILAVGEVTSEYKHMETFGDVDGWDLQHGREIKWKQPIKQTVTEGLRRGTLYAVYKEPPLEVARKIWTQGKELKSENIPEPQKEIEIDSMIDSLLEHGLPSGTAEVMGHTIWRLRRIAKWYVEHNEAAGEHEIRTFLIVPLLTSLGWAEQRIKIEKDGVDIVLLDRPYSDQSKPVLLIESKRLGDGLLYAPDQAERYANDYPDCKFFAVSDGIRYKLYERHNKQWRYSAYMNLLSPKAKHPYYREVDGAVAFFIKTIPTLTISS